MVGRVREIAADGILLAPIHTLSKTSPSSALFSISSIFLFRTNLIAPATANATTTAPHITATTATATHHGLQYRLLVSLAAITGANAGAGTGANSGRTTEK
ncbi:hypothetical protein HPP92_008640 [Vanilla planifolia]|uniref:Uncharacterized protein n=1 Tax=Vanilla planifolia TaxID=51239 RepID=A0A835R8F6_VANPL|nr:hypothetical protein HPP92_008640 [Vanilla planifolia]